MLTLYKVHEVWRRSGKYPSSIFMISWSLTHPTHVRYFTRAASRARPLAGMPTRTATSVMHAAAVFVALAMLALSSARSIDVGSWDALRQALEDSGSASGGLTVRLAGTVVVPANATARSVARSGPLRIVGPATLRCRAGTGSRKDVQPVLRFSSAGSYELDGLAFTGCSRSVSFQLRQVGVVAHVGWGLAAHPPPMPVCIAFTPACRISPPSKFGPSHQPSLQVWWWLMLDGGGLSTRPCPFVLPSLLHESALPSSLAPPISPPSKFGPSHQPSHQPSLQVGAAPLCPPAGGWPGRCREQRGGAWVLVQRGRFAARRRAGCGRLRRAAQHHGLQLHVREGLIVAAGFDGPSKCCGLALQPHRDPPPLMLGPHGATWV